MEFSQFVEDIRQYICGFLKYNDVAALSLTSGDFFNQPPAATPPSVAHLTFGYCFNQPLTGMPPSVAHLTFGYGFDQPFTGKIDDFA